MADPETEQVEAALVVIVPEVEPLVRDYRLEHDPSARAGVPAHLTINYPFLPGVNPDPECIQQLTSLLSTFEPFTFSFQGLARFPDVLYLPPVPDIEFKRLIGAVAAHFPESPPYGGTIEHIIPHLTIAQTEDDGILEALEPEISQRLGEFLPMKIQVDQVWLMDNRSGHWEKRDAFLLGRQS